MIGRPKISEAFELRILHCAERGLSERRIAKLAGCPKSTVHRIVAVGEPRLRLQDDEGPLPTRRAIRWFCTHFLAGWTLGNNSMQPPITTGNCAVAVLQIPPAPLAWFLSNDVDGVY